MAYATVEFKDGFWVSRGATLARSQPHQEGWWAVYDQKGHGLQYVGPFETKPEALKSGLGTNDFKKVIQVVKK